MGISEHFDHPLLENTKQHKSRYNDLYHKLCRHQLFFSMTLFLSREGSNKFQRVVNQQMTWTGCKTGHQPKDLFFCELMEYQILSHISSSPNGKKRDMCDRCEIMCDRQTDGQTDRQTTLEDASRIKKYSRLIRKCT